MATENKPITVVNDENVRIFAKEFFDVVKQKFVTNESLNVKINKLNDEIDNMGRS